MPLAPSAKRLPTSDSTLVIILGASKYSDSDFFKPADAFAKMAAKIEAYFVSAEAYGLANRARQLLVLFDDERQPNEHLSAIEDFIRAGCVGANPATDLIVWYVGHGTFDHKEHYCLTLRHTRDSTRGSSSIRMIDFAYLLRQTAADIRTYFILDACYSGRAPSDFMGGQDARLRAALEEELPVSCVVAFCSAPANMRSHFDSKSGTTVFSGLLLDFLLKGDQFGGTAFHLEYVHGRVTEQIMRHKEEEKRVRPVLHNPKSDGGMVSRVPIFPNRWHHPERAQAKRRFNAVLFDLDGTLLVGYQYSWSLLWKTLGYPEDLRKDLLRQFQRKQITYAQWCQLCCDYFQKAGLTEKMVLKVLRERSIRVVKNYSSSMKMLRERGYVCGIVSGGIDTFLTKLRVRDSHFRHIFINRFRYAKSGHLFAIEPTPLTTNINGTGCWNSAVSRG